MLTIIHGDDVSASRKILFDDKNREQDVEVIRFEGDNLRFADLSASVDSISLFGKKRLVIIENILSGQVTKEKELLFAYLAKLETSDRIIIWEGQEIGKTLLHKHFPKAEIILSQPPALIFKFLDSIRTKSSPHLLLVFREILKNQEAEFVFVMILRQFRYLLVAKDLGINGMSSLSPWQSRKFIQQSRFFTMEQLVSSYRNLLAIEHKIKTGNIPFTLSELIDIFLISL